MHITKIELENIKSHVDSKFEFSRGSTAITGPNGAGKTTLIEAVAWTLFDLLDYKKDDFVRRGAKKGVARVRFESGLDEREYTVYRDTGTGYYVYDPGLKIRIADKKEEVLRFLWNHLGVEPGTDLQSLFKQAIGVPQGTLTAIFLATAADRKRTFDALLKVEEYRRGADELLKTQRVVESQISLVREKIARSEGELNRLDAVKEESRMASDEAARFVSEQEAIAAAVAEKASSVASMDEREAALAELASELQAVSNEKLRIEAAVEQKRSEFEESKLAAAKIEMVRDDAGRHIAALGRLQELERERAERDRLKTELLKVENAEAAVRAEERHIRLQMAAIENSHKEIVLLRPLVDEQTKAEKEIAELRSKQANLRFRLDQAAELEEKLKALRSAFAQNKAALEQAVAAKATAAMLPEQQRRQALIVTELANLRAGLERDERFQSEIKNGLCPILSEKCLNLKEGQTLEGFVKTKFEDVRERIKVLETEHLQLDRELTVSRDAERVAVRVSSLEERAVEIEAEGKRLRSELDAIAIAGDENAALDATLRDAEERLQSLDDPRGRISILERDAGKETEVRETVTKIESNIERLENDRRLLVEQLDDFKELDKNLAGTIITRDSTSEAHRTFLVFESLAKDLEARKANLDKANADHHAIMERFRAIEADVESAKGSYDREVHRAGKEQLAAMRLAQAEIGVRLENAVRRQNEIRAEMDRLEQIKVELGDVMKERDRLEGVLGLTVFIRDTLKEAAPLVARNYVFHVSHEANQLFREITGSAERTLKWADDYGIVLEEGGYERPFQSLSGGEQMAAALSVRLALLKQLSDIRIAFFDEPTTNMDAERRENLAQQIGQITFFDQLFVISHDDTFEGYMDHEIRVGE